MSNSPEHSTKTGKYALPSNAYDVLKDIALIYLPAFGVAYAGLAALWGWGFVAQVTGTVVVVDTLLGTLLKISKTSYDNSDKSNDGTLAIDQSDPNKDKYMLDVTTPLEDVADADKITLKVDNITPAAAPVEVTKDNSQ